MLKMKEAASEQNKFDHKDQPCTNNRPWRWCSVSCVCLKNHDTIAAVVLTQNGSLEGWPQTTLEYIHILSCHFWLLIEWMPFNHPKNLKLRKVLFCLFYLHIRLINLFFENSSNLRFHNANDEIYLTKGGKKLFWGGKSPLLYFYCFLSSYYTGCYFCHART